MSPLGAKDNVAVWHQPDVRMQSPRDDLTSDIHPSKC